MVVFLLFSYFYWSSAQLSRLCILVILCVESDYMAFIVDGLTYQTSVCFDIRMWHPNEYKIKKSTLLLYPVSFHHYLHVFLFITWFMCRIHSHLWSALVRHRIAWHQIISTIFTICTMRSNGWLRDWLPDWLAGFAGCSWMTDSFKSGTVERRIKCHILCSWRGKKTFWQTTKMLRKRFL